MRVAVTEIYDFLKTDSNGFDQILIESKLLAYLAHTIFPGQTTSMTTPRNSVNSTANRSFSSKEPSGISFTVNTGLTIPRVLARSTNFYGLGHSSFLSDFSWRIESKFFERLYSNKTFSKLVEQVLRASAGGDELVNDTSCYE